MKNGIVLFLSCYVLFACTEPVNLSAIKKEIMNGGGGGGIGEPGEYLWTRLPDQDLGEFDYYHQNFPFTVDGSTYCLAGYMEYLPFKLNNRTKRWESFESDFHFLNLSERYLFSYGSKIYYNYYDAVGGELLGYVGAYDMNTSIEQQRASLPIGPYPPQEYISFVIGNKGYLIGGRRKDTNIPLNQIWEYDFGLDQWTNKGTMPGGSRIGGVGFVVGNKLYFGLGYSLMTMNGQTIKRYRKDWLSFDPTSGTYAASLSDFPGTVQGAIRGFYMNDKLYIGYNYCDDNDAGCNVLWEYTIASGKWSKKSIPQHDYEANFFSIGNVGYMVVGAIDEFWRYSTSSLIPANQ